LGAGVGPGVGLGWPGSGVTYGTGVGALVTDPPVITPGLGVGMETYPVWLLYVGGILHLGNLQHNGSLSSATNGHSFGTFVYSGHL
jgi:hypothetical protein